MAFESESALTATELERELHDVLPMRHLDDKPRSTKSVRDVIRIIIKDLRGARNKETGQ